MTGAPDLAPAAFDAAPFDPTAEGWRALPGAALPSGIGVPWAKRHDDHMACYSGADEHDSQCTDHAAGDRAQ